MTARIEPVFRVKEYVDGKPWIMIEHLENAPGFPHQFFFGLDLPDGTSFEKAKDIAEFLNKNITHVTATD
jgi:hypothetical protein